MNTTIPLGSPVTVTADNAEQVLAAVAAATEHGLYRLTVNGTAQDGLYSVEADIETNHDANGAGQPQRTTLIRMTTPTSTRARTSTAILNTVKGFSVTLPVTDLDGSAPGKWHVALEVELRQDAVLLRATEPEGERLVDYTYALEFVDDAPAGTGRRIVFDVADANLESLTATLSAALGVGSDVPAQS